MATATAADLLQPPIEELFEAIPRTEKREALRSYYTDGPGRVWLTAAATPSPEALAASKAATAARKARQVEAKSDALLLQRLFEAMDEDGAAAGADESETLVETEALDVEEDEEEEPEEPDEPEEPEEPEGEEEAEEEEEEEEAEEDDEQEEEAEAEEDDEQEEEEEDQEEEVEDTVEDDTADEDEGTEGEMDDDDDDDLGPLGDDD